MVIMKVQYASKPKSNYYIIPNSNILAVILSLNLIYPTTVNYPPNVNKYNILISYLPEDPFDSSRNRIQPEDCEYPKSLHIRSFLPRKPEPRQGARSSSKLRFGAFSCSKSPFLRTHRAEPLSLRLRQLGPSQNCSEIGSG